MAIDGVIMCGGIGDNLSTLECGWDRPTSGRTFRVTRHIRFGRIAITALRARGRRELIDTPYRYLTFLLFFLMLVYCRSTCRTNR